MTKVVHGKPGANNGGAGGNGEKGGTGNPGGNPSGTTGTGGLLILYANNLNNNAKITSKGTDSNGYGGASGGGSVNIFYNELIKKGTIEATGGNGGEGGSGGNGSVTFLNTNLKSPTITVDKVAETSIKINIEDINTNLEGITYDYYLNDEIYIENTTSKQQTITNLKYDMEYSVKVIKKQNESMLSSNIINIKTPKYLFYVSTDGDDEKGDGTKSKPFASLSKAIDMSEDGYGIYIKQGTYNLNGMLVSDSYNFGATGINDQDKRLEIYGENEKTILVYDASLIKRRDAPAIELTNSETVVRNLTYIFKPRSGSNYSRAIFRWCTGNIENVFFRIEGDYKASYLYNNGQKDPNNIKNCTFYHNLGAIDLSYSGIANFENVATNVLPRDKWNNINTIEKDFGLQDYSITQLINASKEDTDFKKNQVGVFYGENAW